MKLTFKLLIFLAFGLFLLQLSYLFPDIMEARNFVSAREMVDDGNWIFTTMNGEIRYQKPPLPTWLSALMAEIFGTQTLWALRFPAALSCSVLILFFYQFLKKETSDKKLAILTALIFCTTFLVIFIGKRATWDIYSYSFAFIGVYYFYLTLKSEKNNFLHFSLAGLFIGCSILSKGPTGIYVIATPFALAYLTTYGFPKIKWKGWIWMTILTVIIGFSWYAYIYLYDQQNLLAILETEANSRTNRNVKPFTRYLSFPIQMGVWAIFAVVSLSFPYLKKKSKFPKSYTLFFWWTIICLILLSLVPSKKERYLFPLMIPLAATTGIYLYYLFQNQNWKIWEKYLVKFNFGLIALVCFSIPILLFIVLKIEFGLYPILLSISSIIIGLYLAYQTFKMFNLEKSTLACICFVAAATLFGTPVIDNLFNNNPNYHSILTQKETIQKSGLKLYGFDAYSPEVWFKYGEIIPEIYIDRPESLPKENEFYLISSMNQTAESIENELKNLGFKAELIDEFDDNEEKKGGKNHVDRKKMYLFKAESMSEIKK